MSEDQRLLREFTESGSRQALEELIRRHLPLVYSAAVRQVRNSHLAEDVTQAVFLVLTQKASTIRNGVALAGWLLAVTRCTCVNAMKKQAIHKKYELLAAKPEVGAAALDQWANIAPLLDGELNRLATLDRDAVVLRFFQDRSFAEIGAELGLTEEAARKRVTRALDRLRGRLSRNKDSLTCGLLATAIGSYAVLAVPSHVSAGMIAASVGSPAPHCLSLAKGALKMLTYTKAKLVAAVAASVILGATGVVLIADTPASQPTSGTLIVGPQEAQSPAPAVSAPAVPAAPAPAVSQVAVGGGAGANPFDAPPPSGARGGMGGVGGAGFVMMPARNRAPSTRPVGAANLTIGSQGANAGGGAGGAGSFMLVGPNDGTQAPAEAGGVAAPPAP